MLNIKDLEARHKKYKLKSYIPYLVIFIIIIVALFIFNIQLNKNNNENIVIKKEIVKPVVIKKVEINTTKVIKEKVVIKKLPVILTPKVQKQEVSDKKIILTPSLNFMRRVNTTVPYYNDEVDTNTKKVKIKEVQKIEEEVVEAPIVRQVEKKRNIKIKINQDDKDIQHVIRRFKVNNNPALSLFIAKKYYKIGDYQKSYNYALITNQLNNDIEASWIIFSKSLVQLGKKEMAINTLKKYIDDSHSPRAKILLDEIQSGKFK